MAKNDYQALAEVSNPFVENSSQSQSEIAIEDTNTDTENEDGNRDNGIMIHVVPDTSKGTPINFFFWFLDIEHVFECNYINITFSLQSQHDGITSKI